ncbi:hypothetical protein CSA56_00940 [candidate division KSB3 bacterium]|uniref:Uncharacterized protein n=1 Tax=candidate division KSB3 bacterium TaxID=2044937 RepID=A0A2G6KKM7_9BACT|nr:MAG: hypothetical protein CSA56_00940 [candidate division KSB3 bacterium]
MRIFFKTLFFILLIAGPGIAMEQQWVEDLNHRFPGIGIEFEQAVQQKLAQHEGATTVEALIDQLIASPHYTPDKISNPQSFSLHSELMLLYPAVGNYRESLQEAKLLRDFVLKYSAEDERVVQTFRGVYGELLIINAEYENALQEINAAIEMNPNEEGNYLSRGVARVKLGNLPDALEDLQTLIQKPGAERYAQQLFGFILGNRSLFQEAQVQKNTMIDVMLRDMEPPSTRRVKIPANLEEEPEPEDIKNMPEQTIPEVPKTTKQTSAPQPVETTSEDPVTSPSLAQLVTMTPEQLEQLLGIPLLESEGEQTIDRDYTYREQAVTIAFDKKSQAIVSVQMFFLPPVDEASALENIGLEQLDTLPTIDSGMLKVWSPYGNFSKVRLSLSADQVIAVIVEP